MSTTYSPRFTLYTSDASQWAYVAHLTIDEKGFKPSQYDVKQVDLIRGENFSPEYVQINPNGTIPSLTSTSLLRPLIESADILVFLDSNHPDGPSLFPVDSKQRSKVEELIAHVHQEKLSTNIILLQARDAQEFSAKQASLFKDFVNTRQEKLLRYGASQPDSTLYLSRTRENGKLCHLYNASEIGAEHQQFFVDSRQGYKDLAAGINELNSMIVLPYAAGNKVTAADMHIVPWFAHALWGAGGKAIDDFQPLERLIKKTITDFELGEKIKEWWNNISVTDSFQKNYPTLH